MENLPYGRFPADLSAAASVLKDVDPAYLEQKWQECNGAMENFRQVIENAFLSNNYTKIVTESPHVNTQAILWFRYVKNFDVVTYLRDVKNPAKFLGEYGDLNSEPFDTILRFLTARYPQVPVPFFNAYYDDQNRSNLSRFCEKLDKMYQFHDVVDDTLMNGNLSERFLQEAAFITHRELIMEQILQYQHVHVFKIEKAREDGLLLACQCCFEDLLLEDAIECNNQHIFCQDCVVKHCEVYFGNGATAIKCLTDCLGVFLVNALKTALPPLLFEKWCSKQQISEVEEAKIDGLEFCSFCSFACIPDPADMIFQCFNNDCRMTSCRLCKKKSHIPDKCKENEKSKDIWLKIEEAMTNTLVKKCPTCGKSVVKDGGCNNMTCVCGGKFQQADVGIAQVKQVGRIVRDSELQQNPEITLMYDPTL